MDSVTFLKKDDNEKKVNDKKKFFLVRVRYWGFCLFYVHWIEGKAVGK